MDPEQADAQYNLAYAYLFTDQLDSALRHAKISLKLYKDKELKGDAARMVGQILTEQEDYRNALKYYEMSDKLSPDDFYTLKPMLKLYLAKGDKKATATAKRLFEIAPENPSIYQALEEAYSSAGKEWELVRFYKALIPKYKKDRATLGVILGNIHFYLGKLYMNSDKATAKEYFLKAKEIFTSIFPSDHYVFEVIDEALETL